MTPTPPIATDLPTNVFSDIESDWHQERMRLEKATLLAAAELMAHTCASATEQDGFGVSVRIEVIGTAS